MKTLASSVVCALYILVGLAAQAAICAEKMVFLVEDQAGKHVGMSSDFRSYEVVTSGKQWHLYPAISSDGQTLAYVQGEDGESLQLIIEGENGIERFGDKGFQLHPRFAKNDKLVFFSKKLGGVNRIVKYDLEKARAQADTQAEIVAEGEGYFPAPFANGEKLVFQRNGSVRKEIVLLNLLTKEEKILDEGMAPALSKDERLVAYTKKVNGNWDVYVYNLFSDEVTRVTTDESFDFSPCFDKEGNLYYTSDRLENGVFSIFTQAKASWLGEQEKEKLLISKRGTSFYAPRISGERQIKMSQRPAMIGNARSSFGAIAHGGKVYVAGGHQGAEHTYPPESFTARVDAFDPASGKWSNMSPRLNKAHGFQLASHGNYIYAFGGFAYEESTLPKWKSLSVVERYDTETDTWKVVGEMPRRRSSNVVVKVGAKAYLIGGWDSTPKFDNDIDGVFHDEIDVFDFETETFETLEVKLPKKRRAFSAFAKDGIIYLAGGISEGGSHFSLLDDFTAFDPVLQTFTEFPKLPFATFAPAAGVLGNQAFVFGGMLKLGQWEYEYISHIYAFDFAANKWSHTGRYLKEDKGFSQVVELNASLGILGGHSYQNDTDEPVKTFEILDLK